MAAFIDRKKISKQNQAQIHQLGPPKVDFYENIITPKP